MEKTEMMLSYEEETNKLSTRYVGDGIHGVAIQAWNYEYIEWLEDKASKYESIEYRRMLLRD